MRKIFSIQHIDLVLMSFIFLMLFLLPVVFTRVEGNIGWQNVMKIWEDRALLIPMFLLNHWVLVPRLMLKKRYKAYAGIALVIIMSGSLGYFFHDQPAPQAPPGDYRQPAPTPVPPYADLLLFSLLVVSVDTGLSFTKNWHRTEEDRIRLEQEYTNVQLTMLRHQVSPHFFMNTLNNIYALIDTDAKKSKEAVMKLSRLMRYMLYESINGTVSLDREFEFIRSYVDLMALRFADEVVITLDVPAGGQEIRVPAMLFISFIENSFKHGPSYQQSSFVHILFDLRADSLVFTCINSIAARKQSDAPGGFGLSNIRKRLALLYGERFSLSVSDNEKVFSVELTIPVERTGGQPDLSGKTNQS